MRPKNIDAETGSRFVKRSKTIWFGMALVPVLVLVALYLRFGPGSPPKSSPPPPPAVTRDGRWRQDLHYLATELPRLHGNPFYTLKREDFEIAVAELDQAIPQLSEEERWMGSLRRANSKIGVGCTWRFVGRRGDAHAVYSDLRVEVTSDE